VSRKIIVVAGATGAQGGGLARSILADPQGEFAVRALTRDPASPSAQALAAAGHWGVPTFVFEGEPFFGEDRIDTLRWRLGKNGLQRR